MASSLAIRRAPRLALSTRPARVAGYRCLSSASSASPRTQQSRILQQCAVGDRKFSTVGARQAEMSAGMKRMVQDMQKRRAMPSVTTIQMQNLDEVPTDMGFMPDTFIRPTGANVPSVIREPKLRLKMEYHWVKTRVYDIVSRLVYKFTTVKPRPAISRRGIRQLALRLHKDMYTAFAYGDVQHLSTICTDGIFNTFRARINARKPNERLYWARLSQPWPRIVSDRVTRIPVPGVDSKASPCCVRQIVFRIKSKQSLIRGWVHKERGGKQRLLDSHGQELPVDQDGEVTIDRMRQDVRTVDEYFVLQKRMWMGKEESWSVWGLVDESNLDNLE